MHTWKGSLDQYSWYVTITYLHFTCLELGELSSLWMIYSPNFSLLTFGHRKFPTFKSTVWPYLRHDVVGFCIYCTEISTCVEIIRTWEVFVSEWFTLEKLNSAGFARGNSSLSRRTVWSYIKYNKVIVCT